MHTYWVVEVYLHTFLTSALDGGKWSASHPCRFTPGVIVPGIHWIGTWVGSKADLEAMVKKEISITVPVENWTRAIQPVA